MVKIEKSVARPAPSLSGRTASALAAKESANIKVAVRVRPPNERECDANFRAVIDVVDQRMLVFDPKEQVQPFYYQGVQQQSRNFLKRANKELKFMFDMVFGPEATNEDVFKATTKDILSALMDGFNCSVFVYGATGAGKTFTMIGSKEQPGITYLTMEHMFAILDSYQSEREFDIHVSYLEVYNENVYDLLKHSKTSLQLREDSKFGVMVAGLTLSQIKTARELLDMLEHGNRNRTQHPTDANAESSRSHAVFQVYVKMRYKTSGEVRIVKLSMIDLAGSERASATGCVGERFKEGANINRSLLSLGNCINKLADGCKYIPYRDSKLTRLLKDSLGGNCRTIMIANISPSSLSYEDSYNTLKYAARANKIQLNVKKNIVDCNVHVSQYVKIIEELRNQVQELKAKVAAPVEVKKEIEPAVDKTKLIHWRHRLEEEYRMCSMQETRLLNVMSQQRVLVLRQNAKKRSLRNLELLATQNSESQIMEQLNLEDIPRQERSVDYFTRQIKVLQTKWQTLWTKWNEKKTKMSKLFMEALNDCPELSDFIDNLKLNSEHKFLKARDEHKRKIMKIQLEENNSLSIYFCDMTAMLRKMYLILKGYGKMTPAMTEDYMAIAKKAKTAKAVSWEDEKLDNIEEVDPLFQYTTDLDLEPPNDLPIMLLNAVLEEPRTSPLVELTDSDNMTDTDNQNSRKRKATSNGKVRVNETIIIEDSFSELNCTRILTPSPPKKQMIVSAKENIADAEEFGKEIDPKNLNSTFVLAGKLEKEKERSVRGGITKKGLSDMTNTHKHANLAKVMKPVRSATFRKPISTPSGRQGAPFGSTVSRYGTSINHKSVQDKRFNSAQKIKLMRAGQRTPTKTARPLFKC